MTAESSESYRLRQAERCRERARTAASERERSLWLDLASLWLEPSGPGRGSEAGKVTAGSLVPAALSATAGSA